MAEFKTNPNRRSRHPSFEAAQDFDKEGKEDNQQTDRQAQNNEGDEDENLLNGQDDAQGRGAEDQEDNNSNSRNDEELEKLRRELAKTQAERDTQAESISALQKEYETLNGRLTAAQEKDKELEDLKAQLAARDQAVTEAELDKLFDPAQFAEDEDLSPAAAKKLFERVLKPAIKNMRELTNAENAKLKRQLEDTEKRYKGHIEDLTIRQTNMSREQVNREILRAVPKFRELTNEPGFQEMMGRVPPGARQTFGEGIRDAYAKGDVDHVLKVVGIYQKSKSNGKVDDIAEIDTARSSATRGAGKDKGPTFTYDDLSNKRYEFQRGEITREQLKKFNEDFKKAEREGRVS